MLNGWLRALDPTGPRGDRAGRWALALSLAVAIGCALPALFQAFSGPYVVQDDARQHVFWMQRWLHPDRFPNDLMADYFQSVAPWGYQGLYRLGSILGLDPMVFNKLLPIGLGTLTTFLCFQVVWHLLPVPLAAFSACVFLNQNLWIADDLVSGVPVAFIYPLFFLFLKGWLTRSPWQLFSAIGLLAGFYPHGVLLGSSLIGLDLIGQIWLIAQRSPFQVQSLLKTLWSQRRLELSLLIFSGLVLLPFLGKSSQYGPVLTAAEAKTFWAQFFQVEPAWAYWFKHRRTGLIPIDWWEIDFAFPQIILTALFPILWWQRDRFPLAQATRSSLVFVPQLLIVSGAWFTVAHLLLFRLHLPNRYSEHSLRIVVAILGAIALSWLVQKAWQWARSRPPTGRLSTPTAKGLVLLITGLLLIYPFTFPGFPATQYEIGNHPQLYEFFQQQPVTIRIASTTRETDNLPSFAQRSIVVGPGFTMRYHRRYATELLRRATDLMVGQYTPNPDRLREILNRYQVDFWLLDRADFDPNQLQKMGWVRWFRASPQEPLAIAHRQAIEQLRRGEVPVMQALLDRCQQFTDQSLVVLNGNCLRSSL